MSKICDLLKNWDLLTIDERLEVLKEISEEYLKKFGLDQSELQYKTELTRMDKINEMRGAEAGYGLPRGTWGRQDFDDMYHRKDFDIDKNFGHYFEHAKVLFVNPKKLTDDEESMYEAIDTVYHETQHFIDDKLEIEPEEPPIHIGYEDEANETSSETRDDSNPVPGSRPEFHQRVYDISEAITKEKKEECKNEKPADEGYGSSSSVPDLELDQTNDEDNDYSSDQQALESDDEDDEEMDEVFGMSMSK